MGRKEWLEELGGLDAVLQLAPGVNLTTLQIEAMAGFLLSRLGPGTSLRQVCQLSPLGEEQTLSLLVPLARQGIIRPSTERRAPARPRPRPAPPTAPSKAHAERQASAPQRAPKEAGSSVQAPLWLQQHERTPAADDSSRTRTSAGSERTVTPDGPSVAERLAQRRRQRVGGRWAAAVSVEEPARTQRTRQHRNAQAGGRSGGAVEETPPPRTRVTLAPSESNPRRGADAHTLVAEPRPTEPPQRKQSTRDGASVAPVRLPPGGRLVAAQETGGGQRPLSPADRKAAQAVAQRRDPPQTVEQAAAAPETDRVPADPYGTSTPFSADTPPPRSLEQLAAAATDLDPGALAEEVDLPTELKRQVLYLHGNLHRLDYYRLLAVERGAEIRDLKLAFRKRTKIFHPDRYFRRDVGSFGPRITELYKVVSQAYDVLSDPSKRRLYDLTLRQMEEAAGGRRTVSRTQHAERLYHEAKRLLTLGDYQAAETALAQACELEPQEERYRAQLQRVRVLFQRMAASASYARALPALRAGRWDEAVAPLRETVALLPEPEVLLVLAYSIEQSGGDVRESLAFARRALDINTQLVSAALQVSHYEELLSNIQAAQDVLQPFVRHPQERDTIRGRLAELSRRR